MTVRDASPVGQAPPPPERTPALAVVPVRGLSRLTREAVSAALSLADEVVGRPGQDRAFAGGGACSTLARTPGEASPSAALGAG